MSLSDCSGYEQFYSEWLVTQELQMQELQASLQDDTEEKRVEEAVSRALKHYENYYEVKVAAAKETILPMFSPTWTSPLENAFMWIGGWRPSMAFQVLYSIAGQKVESELAELLQGVPSPSLAALTSTQMSLINDLHLQTLKEEKQLSRRMAVLQQNLADQTVVSRAQAQLCRIPRGISNNEYQNVESVLDEKMKELGNGLVGADRLRFTSLKALLEVLSPVQAAQYLITAGQLQLYLHRGGRN